MKDFRFFYNYNFVMLHTIKIFLLNFSKLFT